MGGKNADTNRLMEACRGCAARPRIRVPDPLTNRALLGAETPTNLGIRIRGAGQYYRCDRCGIYFRFETRFFGRHEERFVRVTWVEALSALRSTWIDAGEVGPEIERAGRQVRGLVTRMQTALESPLPWVREFAAENLADYYKLKQRPKRVQELLMHPNSDVRLGALWAFAELPWHSWNLESPGVDFYDSPVFQFRPFMKVDFVLGEVVSRLNDPDPRLRRIVRGFCTGYCFPLKLDALKHELGRLARPWSRELKTVRIGLLYPHYPAELEELVSYVSEADDGVYGAALNRLWEECTIDSTPAIKEALRGVAGGPPPEDVRRFLEDPRPWERPDDNPWD